MKIFIVLISVMSIWAFNYSLAPYVKAEGHSEDKVPLHLKSSEGLSENISLSEKHTPQTEDLKGRLDTKSVEKSLAIGQSTAHDQGQANVLGGDRILNDVSDANRERMK